MIKNATVGDAKRELRRMLNDGISDMSVREFALKITEDSSNQVRTVFDWIKDNIRYQADPSTNELFISPKKMIEIYNSSGIMAGDCDDIALFCASILGSIGYDTRLALVGVDSAETDHAICELYSEELGDWIDIDCISSKPMGWVEKYYSRIIV